MAFTFQEEVSNGIQTVYPVDFNFRSTDTIYVYVGNHSGYQTQISYRWITGDREIELLNITEVPPGTKFYIRRVVDRSGLVHYFENKSIRGSLVDEENLHLLYLMQEVLDGFVSLEDVYQLASSLDMRGSSVKNLAAPVAPNDATSKVYVDALFQSAKQGATDSIALRVQLLTDGLSGNYGYFEKGFEYNAVGDVGIAQDGSLWEYSGEEALPVTVVQGTVPSEPEYTKFYKTIQNITGFGSQSGLDEFYSRKTDTIYALTKSEQVEGYIYDVQGYMARNDGYKGEWTYDSLKPKTYHDGSKTISPTVPWDGLQATQGDWINGVGETDPAGTGCFVLNKKADLLIPKLRGLEELFSFDDRVVTIFAGVDSLTDGAGTQSGRFDDSYFNIVANSLRAHLGDAGAGWTAFDNRHVNREGMNFSRTSDLKYIKTLNRGEAPSIYSLDFCGLHSDTADTNTSCLLGWLGVSQVNWDWDTAEIFYLQQPSGATFEAYQTGSGFVPTVVDTNGALGLQSVVINKDPTKANQIQIDVTVGGVLTLFGIFWRRDVNKGVVCSRLALGGYQTKWYAEDLDPSFQQDWLNRLSPTHYLINGGRNDLQSSTPQEFLTSLTSYVSRFPSTTQKLIISPNESDTDNRTINGKLIRDYRELAYKYAEVNNYGYINNAEVLGNYQEAVNRGWMLDGTHPSAAGNWIIATNILDYMNVPTYPFKDVAKYNQSSNNEDPIPRGFIEARTRVGIQPNVTSTLYELDVVGPGTYLLKLTVLMKNNPGTGIKASEHLLRVVSDVPPGVQSIGTLTSNSLYDDGSTTNSYTVTASINGRGLLQIDMTTGAGNSSAVNAEIYGEYFAAAPTTLLGGDRWIVAN